MPILSLFVIQAIIFQSHHTVPWLRQPPPTPSAVLIHNWFTQEWNKGIHGHITRFRHPGSPSTNILPLHITDPDIVRSHKQQEIHNLPDDPLPLSSCTKATNSNLQALLFSLSTPGVDQTYNFDSTIEQICVDTGASASISTKRENFITLQSVSDLKINGIGTGLPIEGIGILKWPIRDDQNNEIDLFIKDALYVPSAHMGLLCPQQIAQQTGLPLDGFTSSAKCGILTFNSFKHTIPYESQTRLPIFHTLAMNTALTAVTIDSSLHSPDLASRTASMTPDQKLLLRWHSRLSHLHFAKIQELARHGRLPKKLATCDIPICTSCQYGKAHQRPAAIGNKSRPIDHDDLKPGDRVSVDQIESPTPGMVDALSGNPTSARFDAASLYTDHASRFMYIKCHYSTGGAEAILGKKTNS
jgi:hypothetical protein